MNPALADYVEMAVLWVEGKRGKRGVVKDKSTSVGANKRFGPPTETTRCFALTDPPSDCLRPY